MRRFFSVSLILALAVLPAALGFADETAAGQALEEGPDMMWVTWIGSVAALGFSLILALAVLRKEPGNERMKELSRAVQEGAIAYLKQQYKVVAIFFVALFAILGLISWVLRLLSGFVPFAFITGGFFSALAGYIGMSVATRANGAHRLGRPREPQRRAARGLLLGNGDGHDRRRTGVAGHLDLVVAAARRCSTSPRRRSRRS